MEEKGTRSQEFNTEYFSEIFKKNFAIFMIKPDGLEPHVVKCDDGKNIKIDRDFLLDSFKDVINNDKVKIISTVIDSMSQEMFNHYKPTKVDNAKLKEYHINQKHEVFIVYFDSKQDGDISSIIADIYNHKKQIRKKYSEQERTRGKPTLDKPKGEKNSIRTLVHSPESQIELISNLAIFMPNEFEQFIDINKLDLIEGLKNVEYQQKIEEYQSKGKSQKIIDRTKKQYDSFFNTIKCTILNIKQKDKVDEVSTEETHPIQSNTLLSEFKECKKVEDKDAKQNQIMCTNLKKVSNSNTPILP